MKHQRSSIATAAALLVFFVFPKITFSQLLVNSASTPTQMVNNILSGYGVTVSNITYTGGIASKGTFTNGNFTNLGLNSGIILSTGNAAGIANPATFHMSNNLGLTGDANLNAINNGCNTFDACILEFDFVPVSDTVSFRYVFGSEEYPNYVCSQYQDVFAFFVSGPNPSGGNYTNYNIAQIPGTTLPVSVNSINNGTPGGSYPGSGCISLGYSSLFVDNAALGGTTICFGGFTDPLKAWCHVTPCSTYHIKMAVADGYNNLFDSGVFIEAGSFTANTFSVGTSYTNPALGNNAVQGCSQGIFSFVLSTPATAPYTISYTLGGTAVMGTDYSTVPTSITIPPGQDSAAIVINPLLNAPYGTSSVIITYVNGCTPQTDTLYLIDYAPLTATASNDTAFCSGGSAVLNVNHTGGTSPYSYLWSNGSTSNTILVTPAVTTTYTVTVNDNCTHSSIDQVVVTVNPIPVASIADQTDAACNLSNGSATAAGGTTYLWSNGTPFATAGSLAPGTYTCTVTSSGCSSTVSVTITSPPVATLAMSSTEEYCGHADGTATCTPSIAGTYSYLWSNGQSTQTITGLSANTYSVTVTDANGCTINGSVNVINQSGITLTFPNVVMETCTNSNGSITSNAVGGALPYTYTWSNGSNATSIVNLVAGNYTLTLSDAGGCTVVLSQNITNSPGPVVSIASVTNAYCSTASGSVMLTVSGGTAPLMYAWSSGQSTQNLTNVNGGNYSVVITDANGCTASADTSLLSFDAPVVSVSSVTSTCDQSNGMAQANVSGGTGIYSYLWSNGQITSAIIGLSQGTYTVSVNDGNCEVIASVVVAGTPTPVAAFHVTPPTAALAENLFTCFDGSTNASSWNWDFGDGAVSNDQNPEHSYAAAGTYAITLAVSNDAGCTDTARYILLVKEDYAIWVPNAFTPDADGMNDLFGPKGVGWDVPEYNFYVYNRWGEILYHTTNVNHQWDGKYKGRDIEGGVYVWLVLIKEKDGKNRKYSGHVTLLR
ncbi:MAG: choice-of-anchor L domain-containing protein [Bacteroidota bacterium]